MNCIACLRYKKEKYRCSLKGSTAQPVANATGCVALLPGGTPSPAPRGKNCSGRFVVPQGPEVWALTVNGTDVFRTNDGEARIDCMMDIKSHWFSSGSHDSNEHPHHVGQGKPDPGLL